MPDPIFADPRLAAIYDDIEEYRYDLDHYDEIVTELGAQSVLDVGCGTGVLAIRLAARGVSVTGVDPAMASLDVARAKLNAERVSWLLADATSLPEMAVDLAIMTGNVAQIFLTDDEWHATLVGIRRAVRGGGHLVFEVRDPSLRAWDDWTRQNTFSRIETSAGPIEYWTDLIAEELPFVSFRQHYRFLDAGEMLTSDSTLRFRDRDEITTTLASAGFEVDDVRDAPDRPNREFVVIAHAA